MSVLIYNGVQLSDINTLSVDNQAVMNDLDQTELLYNLVTITAQAVVSSQQLGTDPNQAFHDYTLAPGVNPETATQTMERIRQLLLTPRQQLLYYTGPVAANTLLVQSPAPGLTLDAKNGPMPKYCRIFRVGGTSTYLVEYQVETALVECGQSLGNIPPFTSFRYRIVNTIDENFFTRRTMTGKLVVPSDLLVNPDSLRGVVCPAIPKGFKRLSSEYILQEDGTALGFSFVDQEQYLMVPAPATKADGKYIETTAIGGQKVAEVHVALEGAKVDGQPKNALLKTAIQIAMSRINEAGPIGAGGALKILDAAVAEEDLWRNACRVYVRAHVDPDRLRNFQAAVNLQTFGLVPPGSEPGTLAPDPGLRGSAGLMAVAAALHDPCLAAAVNRPDVAGANAPAGSNPIPEPTIYSAAEIPDDFLGLYADKDTPGIYTDYQIKNHHWINPNTKQLPIAVGPANQGYGSGFGYTLADVPAFEGLANGLTAGGSVFVQLAAPTVRLISEWTARRTGEKPKLPNPFLKDANVVFLGGLITDEDEDLAGDGVTSQWTIKGRYEYGYRDNSRVRLNVPVPPWMDPSVATKSLLTPEDFADDIIDAGIPEDGGGFVQGGGQGF